MKTEKSLLYNLMVHCIIGHSIEILLSFFLLQMWFNIMHYILYLGLFQYLLSITIDPYSSLKLLFFLDITKTVLCNLHLLSTYNKWLYF